MSRRNVEVSIVFADISGSTRLYERLGDVAARELVAQCLELMTEHIHEHAGKVIKTIGDEIMCVFPSPESAVQAAIGMQEGVHEDLPSRNNDTPDTMAIRVGLHHGPAIEEAGDVFGDAVNTAARMAGLAKGGQIITTEKTVEGLSETLRASSRHLDRIAVKGKSVEIDIYEIIWQSEEITRMATGVLDGERRAARLLLSCKATQLSLDQDMDPIILGRGKSAHMLINDAMVSREHARIECRRGKFILTDQSTNGTYIKMQDRASYLRREAIVMSGTGAIALGRELNTSENVVSFKVE